VSQKKKIAAVGSIIFDLAVTSPRVPRPGENILARSFKMGPGGKGANAGAALARLGAESVLVGCIGDDDLGRKELAALEAEGVDTSGVRIAGDAPTGVALIIVDDDKENTILVVQGANTVLLPEDALAALDRHWDVLDAVLVDFEIPETVIAAVIAEASRRGVPAIVDAGPPRDFAAASWCDATIVSPNLLEAESLIGRAIRGSDGARRAAEEILSRGPEAVVLKLGREGSLVCTSSAVETVPAFAVDAVDTTGAGDAFTAALTVCIAEGRDAVDAARFANAAGALAVTRFGTLPAMPRRDEIESFLKQRR
jgi:ribokinase